MIKIFISIVVMSMPNWSSVRYIGTLYPTLEECEMANEMNKEGYILQDEVFEREVHYEMFCLEIESYPIPGYGEDSDTQANTPISQDKI